MTTDSVICPQCHKVNQSDARFCSQCGQPLTVQAELAAQQPAPADVFLLYAHADEEMKKQFLTHMAILRRTGRARVWHDGEIEGGREFQPEVDAHMATAKIILMLISASFIASDYCYSEMMQAAMQRHEQGTAKVVPIIIKPVDWEETPFHKIQTLPRDPKKPVSTWTNRDEAWLEVVKGIRDILK